MKKRYGCKFCGRFFVNPHALGGHINSHVHGKKGVKPPTVMCDKCGKAFNSMTSLNSHKGRSKCQQSLDEIVAEVKEATENLKAKHVVAKPKVAKPKKYILVFYNEEIRVLESVNETEDRVVGSMKEIEEALRIDADMDELPDDEKDIKIYEIAKEIEVKYDRKVKVNILQ
jgi:hypothetical protein